MSDIHELRTQMAETKSRETSNNKLFLLLIVLLPIMGLGGGLAFSMTNKAARGQSAPALTMATEETGDVNDALSRLSTKEKWLQIQAQNDKFLAASLQLQEEHPVALKIHQYAAVTQQLAKCADFTNPEDPVLFLISYYGDLNEHKHDQNLKIYKSTDAADAVLKVAGRKIAKAFLLDRNEVTRMFAQVQADLQGVPINGANQKTPECQAVMKLVKSAKMNI